MPNRWVREDAIESESVNSLGWLAEVFWRRLINRVDDFGRFSANVKILRAQIFPLQNDKVSEVDVARLLSECEKAGLLFAYKDLDGKPYLVVNKWEKGRAKFSKYPPPPANICEHMKTYVYRPEQVHANAPIPIPIPTSDSGTDYRLPAAVAEGVGVNGHVKDVNGQKSQGISDLGKRIAKWFGRRESTVWSDRELKALKIVEGFNTADDDLIILERRYVSKAPYIRQDILTLLNNWNGEIDRAKRKEAEPTAETPKVPAWRRIDEIDETIKSMTIEFNATRDEGRRQAIRDELTMLRAERKAMAA